MRKLWVVAAIFAILLLASPAFAYETPVVLKGIAADGKPAANADYSVYVASTGKLVKSGKLNETGVATFNLTDSTDYIFLFKTTNYTALMNYTIPTITAPANQTPVYVTINASAMYHLDVNSVPITVGNVKYQPVDFKNFTYDIATNYTLYTMMVANLTFPETVQSGFAFYKLHNIKVGTTCYNNTTTVKVTMAGNTVVTATYQKEPFMVSPVMAIVVIGLLGAILAAVIIFKKKSTKAAIKEVERRSRYFKEIRNKRY